MPRISICSLVFIIRMPSLHSRAHAGSTLSESSGCIESPDAAGAAGVMATESRDQTLPLVSRLGPREREHQDLALTVACDVDLVAVHEDCRVPIYHIDANLLQDVA